MSKKQKKERLTKDPVSDKVKNLFLSQPHKSIAREEVARLLKQLRKEGKVAVYQALDALCEGSFLEKTDDNTYRLGKGASVDLLEGVVITKTQALAYVKVEGYDEDIVVAQENSMNVLSGDKVKLFILPSKRRGRFEGVVEEVVERKNSRFVGVVEASDNYVFVVPDSRNIPYDIFVPGKDSLGARSGEKVLVEIVDWSEFDRKPSGVIVRIFGKVGDNNAEMHAILAEYGLPAHFDPELETIADKIPSEITPSERKKRRDFTHTTTFTIDPADAKDFDDALSIEEVGDGIWQVGIHIADVTHYVKEGSVLDKEALERATSVYLVDRVVPMLPEKLSNDLCSLRPGEEKLCFSAVFEMNEQGEILSEWFGRTIIFSDCRFSYEEAQNVIETGIGHLNKEIGQLHKLALILRKKRYENGSIAFERDEVKFKLDENGKPIGVFFKQIKDSNHLIEEFMLLANRKVAEFIGKKSKRKERTFVYRVHDKPNEQKYNDFCTFIAKFGYSMRAKTDRAIARELNKLLNKIKGEKVENLFSVLALRSMAKAVYSTENIGHYGLAFDYYTHFTSPIRRYPDMMVHRLLQHYLDGGQSADKTHYEGLCEHSSQQEIKASEAERASIKYKMAEFLMDKIGDEFDGYVSGVTDWGIYVELSQTKIEGMVSVRDMKDDTYQFDGDNYCLRGLFKGCVITLGDPVSIKVLRCDLQRKQIDYVLTRHHNLTNNRITRFETGEIAGNKPIKKGIPIKGDNSRRRKKR